MSVSAYYTLEGGFPWCDVVAFASTHAASPANVNFKLQREETHRPFVSAWPGAEKVRMLLGCTELIELDAEDARGRTAKNLAELADHHLCVQEIERCEEGRENQSWYAHRAQLRPSIYRARPRDSGATADIENAFRE